MAENKVQILSTKFPPPCKIPELDYPIAPRDNLKMVFEHKKPIWMPNTNRDMQSTAPRNDLTKPPMGQSGLDWFGQKWEYVDKVGGHMVAADSWRISEMSNWENELVFPDLDKIDFSVGAEEEEAQLDRSRMIRYQMGTVFFERILDLADPVDGMCFLATEPESAKKFFEAMADFRIKLVDKLVAEWVPVDVITLSDDWGTQISSFMSPEMYEEYIFPSLKRLYDHIRSKGMYCALHSCGKIENLVPIFSQLDFAFWEAQSNNDLPQLKKDFGDKINFRLIFDRPLMETPGVTDDEIRAAVKDFVTTMGEGGGCMANIWSPDPHVYTFTIEEMYRFSKEYYAQ